MRKLVTLICAGMLGAGSVGCELGNTLGDVADQLSNPELESLGEGRKVKAGSFRGLQFDGTAADGAFVVGLRDDHALTIIPFNEGGGCDVGPAYSFKSALLRTEDDAVKLDARIPFQARLDDDEKSLRFTDFECEVDELEIPGGDLPLTTKFAEEPGFIVQNSNNAVYYANPWKNKKQLLAEETITLSRSKHAIFAPGTDGKDRMWTISAGKLLVHDRSLSLEQSGGKDLVSLAHTSKGSGEPMVAVLNQAGDLFVAKSSKISELEQLDQDACGVGFNLGAHGRELVYYSPCNERELIVYELDTGVRRSLGTDVVDYKIVGSTETGPILLYVTNSDTGTLRARWGENKPITLGEKGHLGLSQLTSKEQAQVVVDWSETGGTLKWGKPGEELEVVAKGVQYISSLGIISDYDGNNGRLSELDPKTGELTLLAKKASIHGIRVESATKRALFLANFDGREGDLTLLDAGETQKISANVRPGSYQFTALLPMITVLSDFDAETGTATLKLRYIDREEDIVVSDGVSEALEVGWPREGMLYSVPHGENAGIWFAEAQ